MDVLDKCARSRGNFDRVEMRTVGIVPAAGYGVRLGPLEQSKEMLEVGGRPVWDYLLERMRSGGAEEIRVVTRPEKTDLVVDAEARGVCVVIARPSTVAQSIAVASRGLAGDDVALLGFPDTIWSPPDGFARLVEILADEHVEASLGLFGTLDLRRSDVVVCDADGIVRGVAVKPSAPASDVIWGCAAIRARALSGIAHVDEPGQLFDRLAASGRVRGLKLSDDWIDVGTPEALHFARKRATDTEGQTTVTTKAR